MNKQKFIELLNNPGALKEINLQELDEIVSENPYFQAARVLEAKGHRRSKSKVAGRKTASAAIYSTNRVLLKQFLASDGVKVEKPVAAKPTPIEEKQRPTIRPAEKPVSQVPSPTPSSSASPGPVPSQVEDASGSSIDQLIYSLHKDMEELEKSRARYMEVSRKIEEEEAVEKAVKKVTKKTEAASSKPKEEKKQPVAKSAETTDKADTSSKTKAPQKASSTKKTSASKPKAASEKKSTTAKKPTTTKTASKSSKAKSGATKSTPAKKTTKAGSRKATPKTTAKKSTSRASKSSKTTKSSKKDDHDGVNQNELIDQFIKSNPSFKPAPDTGEQGDLSVESSELPDDIGTEYLAEIFLNQGKKDKAIKIYNSLMLRFPEKKAYFAGRIKKIK